MVRPTKRDIKIICDNFLFKKKTTLQSKLHFVDANKKIGARGCYLPNNIAMSITPIFSLANEPEKTKQMLRII